ncbi:MAG: magnesium chelatase subunit D [Pseudomonadota bacterium]
MTRSGIVERSDSGFDLSDPWQRACAARDILAVAPYQLGGLLLRARYGPARETWIATAKKRLQAEPFVRLHPQTQDESLYGAVDVAATLKLGREVRTQGILAGEAKLLLIPSAEAAEATFAARIACWLDAQGGAVIMLDEGADTDEKAPDSLAERLALHISLEGVPQTACDTLGASFGTIQEARERFPEVRVAPALFEDMATMAVALGIDSLRAPSLAVTAARAAAALAGRTEPDEADVTLAATLVLAPRLRRLPDQSAEETQKPPPPEEPAPDTEENNQRSADKPPDEMPVETALARLPPGLLAELAAAMAPGAKAGRKARTPSKNAAKGPFAPSRPGRIASGTRVDLISTLRRAAPWQTLRRRERPEANTPILIRPEDIAVSRRRGRAERLAIFAVDASGSTAMGRLAECKGAVELLLADAYRRRDQVAVIAFRGRAADVLLPPTRSMVQTKRRLSRLPGGGPTPLASGLDQGFRLAEASRRRGMSPTLVVMTDGRGNIALDGSADRAAAKTDLMDLATAIRRRDIPGLVVDISRLPRPAASELAERMGATYLPLPAMNAKNLSNAVRQQWSS